MGRKTDSLLGLPWSDLTAQFMFPWLSTLLITGEEEEERVEAPSQTDWSESFIINLKQSSFQLFADLSGGRRLIKVVHVL